MKRTLYCALVSLLLTACASGPSSEQLRAQDRQKIQDQLNQEMSLKADREQLAELRKDIPTEKQKENDEMALFLNMMNNNSEHPQVVRDRFHKLVQDKRSTFRKKVQRLREDYRKEETRRREDFMKAQKNKREDNLKRKRDASKNRQFYSDQEKERMRFNSDERDRRQSFEAELNAQSKDFDSYMRERQKQFDEQYRIYSKKHGEKSKAKKAVTGDTPPTEEILGTEN